MSALSDVQDAFVVTLTQMNTYLDDVCLKTPDVPIELLKVARAYSVVRAAVVAALATSATAQAAVAAGHVALNSDLLAITTLSGDVPIERAKIANADFKAVGVAVAALT